MEYARFDGQPGGPFVGLAARSGFSVRNCEVAAASGRLPGIVRVAELRSRQRRLADPDRLSGAQVLARLQLPKGRLLDERLRAAGLL